MAAGGLVKHLNVVEDIGSCQVTGFIVAFFIRSFFKLLKNDSATALSQQLPRRLMLGSRLWSRQKRIQSTQRSNAMSVTMLIDKALLYSASLAKYRAAFLRYLAPPPRDGVGRAA